MVVSLNRWKGKVAVVTGASAGIGASIVRLLVTEGLKVVGIARRKEKIDDLSKNLSGKSGQLYAVKADMSKEEDILAAFKWIKNNVGPVSILINNAGVMRTTSLSDGNTESWKAVLNTNVLGLSIATREAIKDMKANNIDGHIIHINSLGGHLVPNIPDMNVYPASKFAVTALTETLRQELVRSNSKIKVTSISPGGVDTEMVQRTDMPMTAEYLEILKSSPLLKSEDIADAVVYALATPPHVQVRELSISPVGQIF